MAPLRILKGSTPRRKRPRIIVFGAPPYSHSARIAETIVTSEGARPLSLIHHAPVFDEFRRFEWWR